MLLQEADPRKSLDLNQEDLLLQEAQIRVRGKGNIDPLPSVSS